MRLQGDPKAAQQPQSYTLWNLTLRSRRLTGGYQIDIFSFSRDPVTKQLTFELFKAKVPEPVVVAAPSISATHLQAAIQSPRTIEMVAQRQGVTSGNVLDVTAHPKKD